MDQERRDWFLRMQQKMRSDAEEDAEILSHNDWKEDNPGVQARLALNRANERLCNLVVQYGDEVFQYFDSAEGQALVRELVLTYQMMRIYVNEEEIGIDCEDDLAFLLSLLHE